MIGGDGKLGALFTGLITQGKVGPNLEEAVGKLRSAKTIQLVDALPPELETKSLADQAAGIKSGLGKIHDKYKDVSADFIEARLREMTVSNTLSFASADDLEAMGFSDEVVAAAEANPPSDIKAIAGQAIASHAMGGNALAGLGQAKSLSGSERLKTLGIDPTEITSEQAEAAQQYVAAKYQQFYASTRMAKAFLDGPMGGMAASVIAEKAAKRGISPEKLEKAAPEISKIIDAIPDLAMAGRETLGKLKDAPQLVTVIDQVIGALQAAPSTAVDEVLTKSAMTDETLQTALMGLLKSEDVGALGKQALAVVAPLKALMGELNLGALKGLAAGKQMQLMEGMSAAKIGEAIPIVDVAGDEELAAMMKDLMPGADVEITVPTDASDAEIQAAMGGGGTVTFELSPEAGDMDAVLKALQSAADAEQGDVPGMITLSAETGNGKTAAMQHLAQQIGAEIQFINLGDATDAADLAELFGHPEGFQGFDSTLNANPDKKAD